MTLQPMLIAPFKTGLETDITPWIAPPDALQEATNVHVKDGRLEKRSGLQPFATLSQGLRVMGIGRYYVNDGTIQTIAWDTTRAYRYNGFSLGFDIMDVASIMSGSDTDYIWFVNWQATGGTNRLYFSNGKAFDGASLDGIRYYDNTGLSTTSFVPDLDSAGTRKLYGGKLLFSIKQRLIVLNTYELDGGTKNFPQRARWCAAQNPDNWNDVSPGGGGYVDAPTGEQIISARQIEDKIVVYFTNSVWTLVPVSNPALPFRWIKVNNFRAANGKMASTAYDEFIVSLGVRGITATDTNQTKRIDQRIEDFVGDEINIDQFGKVFCERDYQSRRWWTLYPGIEAEENDSVLIYADDNGSFTKYDLALNCLGYGEQSTDLALDDFTVANDLDYTIIELANETIADYYSQENEELLLGGDTSGNIFIVDTDGDDNGSEIEVTIETTAWNPYQEQGADCQMSYIDVYLDSAQNTTATLQFFKDSSFYPYAQQNIDLLPDLGFIATVNDISLANPASVNAPSHGLSTGDKIYIYNVSGMVEINAIPYTVTVVDEDNFTLDGIDSSGFTAYTGGGVVVRRQFYRERIWKRAFAGGIGNEHVVRLTSGGTDTPLVIHAFKPYFQKRGRRTID